MDKQNILKNIAKEEDKLLISKILDKFQYAVTKNKIVATSFLNPTEKHLSQKVLNQLKITNYLFYGAYENCERCIIVFYPEKFDFNIVETNYDNIISIVRISLPKELHDKYNHRDYLGGIMKLGVSREKVGDILVSNDGADIIISKDIQEYLINSLPTLTRFKKSQIELIKLENLRIPKLEFEEIQIIVSSLRLDLIVSELIHSSRSNANEYISSERVFVNFELETKLDKRLKEKDTITIRGKRQI